MGFFNKYPYTDFHELNLDYVLNAIKLMQNELQNFINFNSIKYADPLTWDITTQYAANTVVINSNTGIAYLSTQSVPAGVPITNTNYWNVVFDLSPFFDNVGDLNDLLTTDRTSIVNAINEIFTNLHNFISSKEYVTPEMYGAVGDGTTDDTAAISAAVTSGKPVLFISRYGMSDRVYPINDMYGLPDSEIIVLPDYAFNPFKIEVDNILVDGLNITGNKNTITITPTHYEHGIWIESDNVTIRHCVIKDTTGDGIYFGGSNTTKNTCIENCVIDNCTRNGISVISAHHFNIIGCNITNITGSDPSVGIDFEPNDPFEEIQGNVVNCYFSGSDRGSFQFGLFNIGADTYHNINIIDCVSDGDGIDTAGTYTAAAVVSDYVNTTGKVDINFKNFIINNPVTRGLYIRHYGNTNCFVDADIKVTNCTLNEAARVVVQTSIGGDNVSDRLKIMCDDSYTGNAVVIARGSSTELRGFTGEIWSNKPYANGTHTTPKIYFNTSMASPDIFIRFDGAIQYKSVTDVTFLPGSTGEYTLTTGYDYSNYSFNLSNPDHYKYTITAVDTHTWTFNFVDSSNNPVNISKLDLWCHFSVA